MTDASSDELDGCIRTIDALWADQVDGSGHEASAREAAANLMSGSGFMDAPYDVLRMLTNAIEVGYAAALRAVEDGEYDDKIQNEWRAGMLE
ncbi:MAG TPA: hypothetical protein VGP70_21695 [Actinomadura sp.]|jgi:hypothetical protein|nr:hypothetical protein [Actinomadura sp.]